MTSDSDQNRLDPRDLVRMRFRYEEKRGDHFAWIEKAQVARHAARRLMHMHEASLSINLDGVPIDECIETDLDMQLHGPAMTLAAHSIEMMLKAIILKTDSHAANIEHHDLKELARTAGVSDILDADALERLRDCIEWKGRYPVSKASKKGLAALAEHKEHVDRVLVSGKGKLKDIRPKPGSKLPRADFDYSAAVEDYGGTFAVAFFKETMKMYDALYDRWCVGVFE